jgi:hypothetical protein
LKEKEAAMETSEVRLAMTGVQSGDRGQTEMEKASLQAASASMKCHASIFVNK